MELLHNLVVRIDCLVLQSRSVKLLALLLRDIIVESCYGSLTDNEIGVCGMVVFSIGSRDVLIYKAVKQTVVSRMSESSDVDHQVSHQYYLFLLLNGLQFCC